MENSNSIQWYVARVKSRHEKTVANAFAMKGFESLVPMYLARRKWSDREQAVQLPYFPGYVFCRFSASSRISILNTVGVYDILKFCGELAPVDPGEIDALQKLVRSGLQAEPLPRLEPGDFVEIQSGPLDGCSGYVTEIRKQSRLVLSVTLLQRSVSVELDRLWVSKRILPKTSRIPVVNEPSVLTRRLSA